MADCDACPQLAANPDFTLDDKTALREILKVLCNAFQPSTPFEQVTIAFGAVSDPGYAVLPELDISPAVINTFTVYNTTNVAVFASLDGTTDHYVIPAGAERTFPGSGSSQVWIRSATAPGSGSVFISGN